MDIVCSKDGRGEREQEARDWCGVEGTDKTPLAVVDACFPLHPRASLSSRLHKGRILSRSAGDAVGQCSEVGVGEAIVRCSEAWCFH